MLCLTCGQVFRFEKLSDEEWVGVDGDHWYRLKLSEGQWQVETNGTKGDFEKLFRLDEDLNSLEERILKIDPGLKPYVETLSGLRLMRPSDPVEAMFSFLCTPNNNLSRIVPMVRTLGACGQPLTDALSRFPDVETLADVPEQFLRDKGFGYRARTIPHIAQQVLEKGGGRWIERLTEKPYDEAHAALCELKGVGPKLADCIALFALHNTWAVPVDTHLWQAAVRCYFPQWEGASLTDTKYREIGSFFRERFGELAGWAHQYLFVDNMLRWRNRVQKPQVGN